MREIKFRVWHDEAKDMVYFGLGEDHLKAYSLEDDSNYTLELEHGYPVMQYTGIKDSNGQEVYEGDIVKFYKSFSNSSGYILPIFWDEEDHAWGAGLNDHHKTIGCRGAIWCHSKEVIGNIYENPELLEE